MKLFANMFFAALFFAALVQTSLAQTTPKFGPGSAGPDSGKTAPTPQEFSDMKKQILTLIEDRKKWLDEEKTCVEAAKTTDELKKCRPVGPRPGQKRQF